MFWALLIAAVFAWLGGMLGVVGLRARSDQVPYRSPLGLRGHDVRASVGAWDAGHRAAAPFILTAAVICLLQAAAATWTAFSPELSGGPYLPILAVTGAVLVTMLLFLANSVGNRAAR